MNKTINDIYEEMAFKIFNFDQQLEDVSINEVILNDDICDDETKYFKINFLKTIALKLNQQYLQTFFNKQYPQFPLLLESSKFINNSDAMVRTTAWNTIFQIIQLSDQNPQVSHYIRDYPFNMTYHQYFQYFLQEYNKICPDKCKLIDNLCILKDLINSIKDYEKNLINGFLYSFLPYFQNKFIILFSFSQCYKCAESNILKKVLQNLVFQKKLPCNIIEMFNQKPLKFKEQNVEDLKQFCLEKYFENNIKEKQMNQSYLPHKFDQLFSTELVDLILENKENLQENPIRKSILKDQRFLLSLSSLYEMIDEDDNELQEQVYQLMLTKRNFNFFTQMQFNKTYLKKIVLNFEKINKYINEFDFLKIYQTQRIISENKIDYEIICFIHFFRNYIKIKQEGSQVRNHEFKVGKNQYLISTTDNCFFVLQSDMIYLIRFNLKQQKFIIIQKMDVRNIQIDQFLDDQYLVYQKNQYGKYLITQENKNLFTKLIKDRQNEIQDVILESIKNIKSILDV